MPFRRCVACGARRPQHRLIRLYRQADGSLALTGSEPRKGRGAYCCPVPACCEKTIRKKLFARSLKSSAHIADPDRLLREIAEMAAIVENENGVEDHGKNHR